jgi:hypothetical protein
MLLTQYLRPNGEKREVHFAASKVVELLAEHFQVCGGKYECEELTTGQVSITACFPDEEDNEMRDIAIRVCTNGPAVPFATQQVVVESIQWLKKQYPDLNHPTFGKDAN